MNSLRPHGLSYRVQRSIASITPFLQKGKEHARENSPIRIQRRQFHITRRTSKYAQRLFALLVILIIGIILFGNDPRVKRHHHIHSRSAQQRLLNHATKPDNWSGWQRITTIFTFGDSYSDTGFDIDGAPPNPENPTGNPPWPGMTANVGPNFINHLTATFNKSYVQTYNLARSGSPIAPKGAGRTRAQQNRNPSLSELIDHTFLPRYGKSKDWKGKGNWRSKTSLFILWAGLDDILFSFDVRRGNKREGFREAKLEASAYAKNLHKLYDHGARNFVIVNIPTIEESPKVRNSDITNSMVLLGAEIVDFNGRVAFEAAQFAEAHPDATVFYFDAHHLSLLIRRSPYRFPETASLVNMEGYCYFYADRNYPQNHLGVTFIEECGVDISQWYWRDDVHMTEPFHRLLARLMVKMMADPGKRLPYEFY